MALFEPIQVGDLQLQHRIVLPPLTRLRSVDLEVEYYRQRAQEPGTLLIAGVSPIDEFDIDTDKQFRDWKRVADVVHSQKSYIFLQIGALGRSPETPLSEVLRKGAINSTGRSQLSTSLIREYIQWHADAARRAVEAGFDGVEIHAAHGYLLDQFLHDSAHSRKDEFGGNIENRARFTLDVVDAVSHAITGSKVGVRISPFGLATDGHFDLSAIPVFAFLVAELERQKNIAYLHIVEPRVEQDHVGFIRDIWTGPLLRAGGFTPDTALEVTSRDSRTLVAFGRWFISNPDLVNRLRHKWPLTPYDRSTFYAEGENGYTDYPNYNASKRRRNTKKLILNAFAMTTPNHLSPGLWRHPASNTENYNTLEYWTKLAELLERGKFHSLFLADTLGPYDVYHGPENPVPVIRSGTQFPVNDPSLAVSAMAAVTSKLAFGVTTSTTYEHPYTLARRFSTLDHLTNGRIIWNIVTSYLESAAKLYGLPTQIEHDERYKRANEFLQVCYKLWEGSWQDDAALRDKVTGQFANPEKVRAVNHEGNCFKVNGIHIAEPSPQRTPLLFQAGASSTGSDFGAKHSEMIFISGISPKKLAKTTATYRSKAAAHGRHPHSIKVVASVAIIVDETDEKARAKYEEFVSYADVDGALSLFGGWTGVDLSPFSDDDDFRTAGPQFLQSTIVELDEANPENGSHKWTKSDIAKQLIVGGFGAKFIGSPTSVVDELEKWAEEADLDGFNLVHITSPGSFEDIVKWVIPELQHRGLFHEEYEDFSTARGGILGHDHLAVDHPGYEYKWLPGENGHS